MVFTFKVSNAPGTATGSLTTEASAIGYTYSWAFNEPMKCTVIIADPLGTKAQTYLGVGSANQTYMYSSRAVIYEGAVQDSNIIFNGRIIGGQRDTKQGLLMLVCEDWLGQYKDKHVVFDTRENLKGNDQFWNAGPRSSEITISATQHTHYAGTWLDTGVYYLQDYTADVGATWAADEWNNGTTYYVAFSHDTAGPNQRQYTICYNAVVEGETTKNDDEKLSWWFPEHIVGDRLYYLGGSPHTLWAEGVDVLDDTMEIACYFHMPINNHSANLTSYDDIIIHMNGVYMQNDPTDGNLQYHDPKFQVYNQDTESYQDVVSETGKDLVWHNARINLRSVSGLDSDLSKYFENGIMILKFITTNAEAAGGREIQPKIAVGSIGVELVYTGKANETVFTISDSDEYLLACTSDWLDFSDGMGYSICRLVTDVVKDLTERYGDTGSSGMHTIDHDGAVTASSKIVAMRFIEQTPLSILQTLADADGTVFWMTQSDDTKDFVWNAAFGASGGTPTLLDANVLSFSEVKLDGDELANEIHFHKKDWKEPLRTSNADLWATDPGLTSKTNYGFTKTKVYAVPQAVTTVDVYNIGDYMIDRYDTVPLRLVARIAGHTTASGRQLGDVVCVTAAEYGVTTTDFIVYRKDYDSKANETRLYLAPRNVAGIGPERRFESTYALFDERIETNVEAIMADDKTVEWDND